MAVMDAIPVAASIARLPGVRSAIAIRFADASVDAGGMPINAAFQGVSGDGSHPWTVLAGHDIQSMGDILVNERVAERLAVTPGTG